MQPTETDKPSNGRRLCPRGPAKGGTWRKTLRYALGHVERYTRLNRRGPEGSLGHVDLTLGHFDLGIPRPADRASTCHARRDLGLVPPSERCSMHGKVAASPAGAMHERWPPARLVRYFGAAVISISVEGRATSLAHAHCGAGAASAQRAAKRWFSLRSRFRNTLAFRNSAERKPRGKQHGDHRG